MYMQYYGILFAAFFFWMYMNINGWLSAGIGIPISLGYNIEALPSTRYFGLMRKLAKSGQDDLLHTSKDLIDSGITAGM